MTEVLIIGGGIIGLSIARELRKKGVRKVRVLEKNLACGMEASNAAAGMLAPQAEADNNDDFFNFCQTSRDLYPNFAEELLEETGIDIELDRTGTLYLAFTEKDKGELESRFFWQKRANLQVEKLSAKEVLEIEPNVSPKVLFGLRFAMDWQVENRKIIEAFVKTEKSEFVAREVKSLIFENYKVIGVKTDLEKIYAPIVIIASGAWTSLIKDKFDLLSNIKVKPIRGQMIAFNNSKKLFRHVIYNHRGYAVPRKDCRILVGATVEDVGFNNQTNDVDSASLVKVALEISPAFENLCLKNTWASLRPFAADGLPILGEFPEIENLYIATAHYRNGILLAPLTAKILANKIVGNVESKYLKTFSPRRFTKLAINGK